MTKTTLILGAGASRPFGFPTAVQLREIIVHRKPAQVQAILTELGASGDLWEIATGNIIGRYGQDELTRLQEEFFQSQTTSIDQFVQQREGAFTGVATYTLAAILLQCEASAYLNRDWYGVLRDAILQNGLEHIPTARLQIVTFNYDRSLEVYLWGAIQHTFGLREGDAYQRVEALRIHHVYGSLGELRNGSRGRVVPWASPTEGHIRDASTGLHLVRPLSEGLPAEVRDFMKSSEFVCFLGFGFWPENVSLVRGCVSDNTQVYSSNHRGLNDRLRFQVASIFPKMMWGRETAEQCMQEWNILPRPS